MSPDDLPPGLRAFLDDDVALLPKGLADAERTQLVAILQARGDVARLDRLAGSPDKALAKAARKAIHLLRTRGAAPATVPARVYRVAGPYAAEEETPSYASIVDGRGERVLWYVEPGDLPYAARRGSPDGSRGEKGWSVFEVELSESAGVQSVVGLDVTRKGWRDQVAHMRSSERAIVGEIPGAHARVLVERAYRAMLADGRSPPEAFARFHLRLQASDEELAAPHPLRALVGDVRASEAELAAVLERVELSLFVPSREAVSALDVAIGEVVTSQIILEPAQKIVQVEAAIARVADQTLDAAQRTRLADRLLELGLLVASRQPDEAGRAAARACLVAADRARDLGVAAHDHPTLIGMFRRLVPAELLLELAEPGR